MADQSFGILETGVVWAWGRNLRGQLGDETNTDRSSPVAVVGGHLFVALAMGRAFPSDQNASYGFKSDGSVWAWGFGTSGQLGDNTLDSKSSPVVVAGNHTFNRIAGGSRFGIGVKSAGDAWAWGVNASGSLGDNSTTVRSSPVSVVGDHNFTDVEAGDEFAFGLKSNGEAWAWGEASSGQLGDNSTTDKSSPVQVVGGHLFDKVEGGSVHALGLKSNGTAWAWGNGSSGRLGDGSATSKSSPVAVIGGHSFDSISAGGAHSLGLKSDGSVWAWGFGTSGQLGDGTATSKSSPVSVVGGHSFTQILGGEFHSLALKANGEIWSWGDADRGQLGNDSATDTSSPVLVVGGFTFVSLPDHDPIVIPRARIMGGGSFNSKKKPRHLPPSTAPELLLHNTTEEDSDGGRESSLRWKGEQSGGELNTLAMIRGSHDGAADDEKGKIEFLINDTNDSDSPTLQGRIDSVDLTLERGVLSLAETTTPSAVAGYGKVYNKADNRFYVQDGAGDEHRIVTSDYAGIYVDDNEVEMVFLLQDAYEPVLVFGAGTVSGVNMPEIISSGDFANNKITIGASADYNVNIHINAESAGVNKVLETDVFMIAASGESITAGGITQANPGVVNITGHSFNDGDRVKISGVSGMTEVNGQIYTVTGAGANDFQLNDDNGGNINTTGYGAYTSGGTVFLATCVDVAHAHRMFGAGAGDVGSFSGGGIAALVGGDTLEVHMKNISDATNMTTESIQLSIIRL